LIQRESLALLEKYVAENKRRALEQMVAPSDLTSDLR